MKQYNIRRMKKILDLEEEIVGVKFIRYKKEYDELNYIDELGKKVTYCNMIRRAMDGTLFKVNKTHFFCNYGAYALGIKKPDISVASGQSYSECQLYETVSVSRKAVESMRYLNHDIYGVLIGPLKDIKEADVVIIIGNTYQTMRIMQGYAYKNGMPQNIRSFGNQAMCSDITSKPFYENDINVSFLCAGARMYGRYTESQLGIGMPIGLFDTVVEGVVMTFNPVARPREKKALEERLEGSAMEELGIEIDMNADYGCFISKYDEYVKKVKMNNE